MNELARENKDQGLVLIGIHTEGDAEKMPAFVDKAGIEFPVCIDAGAIRTYGVDSYPDYYLVDRAGRVRVADLANGSLDEAIALLLAEPAPLPLPGDAACEDSPNIHFKAAAKGDLRSWELVSEVGDLPHTIRMRDKVSDGRPPDEGEGISFGCRARNDELLTPLWLNVLSTVVEDCREYKFERKADHVVVRWETGVENDATPDAFDVPRGTVLDLMLPRITSQRPFEVGSSITFPMLAVRGRSHTLHEEVELVCVEGKASKATATWRYDLRDGEQLLESYWVDEQSRTLVRMKLGDGPTFEIQEQ